MKKISVIVPTYNRSKTLKRAINSVFMQNDPSFEILVCDNGSTDDTYKMIKSLDSKYIRWIDGSTQLQHPGAMRNLGLEEFSGDYVCFLDSDDFFKGPHLQEARNLLKKNSFICEYSNTFTLRKDRRLTYINLALANSVITSSVVLNSDIVTELGKFPVSNGYRVYEDYAYWLRAATITKILQKGSNFVQYQSDSKDSIRKSVTSNLSNLKIVFNDFENWAKVKNINLKKMYYVNKNTQLLKSFVREIP